MGLSGIAELPLHTGHVPPWLARYMKRLAKAIAEAVVELYGPDTLVERLADPFWFQAFNNAIGMDWDSSGSTTVTLGILKQVAWENPGLGIVVAGGKGANARRTPEELERAEELGLLPSRVAREALRASRLAAKTDSALLQDGYTLYHHAVVASEHRWAVIQQGMNLEARMARRYHWVSPLPSDPTLEPHSAIASSRREQLIPLDMTSRLSEEARKTVLDLARENPRRVAEEAARAWRLLRGDVGLDAWLKPGGGASTHGESAGRARLLARVYRPQPLPPRRLEPVLRRLRDASPRSLEELVLVEGVGPAVVRSLALVAELVYGAPVSHRDPADTPLDPFRYAYVVGGKDGVPFPFRRDYAEAVIGFLEEVVAEARLGEKERRQALERLRRLAGLLER